MPLYNEEQITDTIDKTRWEYAHKVILSHPIGGVPSVNFQTSTAERDNETGEERLIETKRVITEQYAGNEVFDVVDLQGNVVGQADYDTTFALLYSLFFHVAAKTDAP